MHARAASVSHGGGVGAVLISAVVGAAVLVGIGAGVVA
jgi:hypothetical protein